MRLIVNSLYCDPLQSLVLQKGLEFFWNEITLIGCLANECPGSETEMMKQTNDEVKRALTHALCILGWQQQCHLQLWLTITWLAKSNNKKPSANLKWESTANDYQCFVCFTLLDDIYRLHHAFLVCSATSCHAGAERTWMSAWCVLAFTFASKEIFSKVWLLFMFDSLQPNIFKLLYYILTSYTWHYTMLDNWGLKPLIEVTQVSNELNAT